MVEITHKIGVDGDIICFADCQNKSECANHESALDMRTECGPRPKLTLQEKTICCSTFNNSFMAAKFGAVTQKQLDLT